MKIKVYLSRISPEAVLPKQATEGASGFDLVALRKVMILSKEWARIHTGIAVEIPAGFEGQVRPRSGLAYDYGVTVLNSPGTIDSDYRGEISVLLINHGFAPFTVYPGARIAQLVISPVASVVPIELDQLSTTKRGSGGFGSTGR